MCKTTTIYALCEPDTGETRYVGKSNNPTRRWYLHCKASPASRSYKDNWICSLRSRGLRPKLRVLIQVPQAEWEAWERAIIKAFRVLGIRLTNSTEGGEGVPGGKKHPMFGKPGPNLGKTPSPETIAKMRAAAAGLKNPSYGHKKPGATSKFFGVHLHKPTKKWVVHVGRSMRVGYFDCEEAAARAYDKAAREILGPTAKTNFPN